MEKTFVMVKPDGVKRSLVGEIVSRFEKAGLIISRMEMMTATRERIEEHYPSTDKWFTSVGEKTKEAYVRDGLDLIGTFGSDDEIAIGKTVKSWLAAYMTSGPVVAMILEGNKAVSLVRKMVGHTFPSEALPGTIRGDYSVDSPDLANAEKRSVTNLIHASGEVDEAKDEIALWFGE